MGDRVLVTGGSGFLGGHVIPLLVARGYDVVALARSDDAAAKVEEAGARAIRGDLDDSASLDEAFAAADATALVNLASLGFGQAPAIVSAAAKTGLARGVYVSSTAIFTTVNAPSKPRRKAGEDTVTASTLDWTVIRPTMIYGTPGDRNLARLLRVLRRLPVPVLLVPGGGARLQQPVHVDDLAVAIVNALERPETIHRAYNVAGPEAITFRELLEQSGATVGRRPRLVSVPLRPTIAAVALYERVSSHPRLKAEQLERLSEDKAFEINDAHTDLGFDPRPFIQGIRDEAALLTGTVTATGRPTGGDHFEDVAESWIRRYETHPSFRHRLDVLGPLVVELLADAPGSRVLDFGGGPGVLAALAAGHAASVVCVDASTPMVLAGARRADTLHTVVERFGSVEAAQVLRVVGTVDTLGPTAAGSFDLVLAIAVLETLDDPAGVLAALGATLKPGGRLLLTVPDPRAAARRAEELMGSVLNEAGRVLRSERMQSRAHASVRSFGNRVPWREGAARSGLEVTRTIPLALGAHGWRARVRTTTIVVLARPTTAEATNHAAGRPRQDRNG